MQTIYFTKMGPPGRKIMAVPNEAIVHEKFTDDHFLNIFNCLSFT